MIIIKTIQEDANSIKKDYIKSKFVEATKSIIVQEGVFNVSVRKIAKITGYSYASVYHYFLDLNELLLETKLSMIHDTVVNSNSIINVEEPLEKIKLQARMSAEFFINNSNIFEFFYQYKMDESNAKAMKSLKLENEYYKDFIPFVESGVIKESDIPSISRAITYTVFGSITIYMSNNGLSKEEAFQDVDNTIDMLLRRK